MTYLNYVSFASKPDCRNFLATGLEKINSIAPSFSHQLCAFETALGTIR